MARKSGGGLAPLAPLGGAQRAAVVDVGGYTVGRQSESAAAAGRHDSTPYTSAVASIVMSDSGDIEVGPGWGLGSRGSRVQYNLRGPRFEASRSRILAVVVSGSRSRVAGSGFRVQGCGLRVAGCGFRVQGSGSRVSIH